MANFSARSVRACDHVNPSAMSMKPRWVARLIIPLQICILDSSVVRAADFSGADLSNAHLTNANLRGSNLTDANLTGANLDRANLTDTNVTQYQLDSACGSWTQLPAGLTIEPCSTSTDSAIIGTERRASAAMSAPVPINVLSNADNEGLSEAVP
jgi:uncharacterized protein YjbI with pentapeptide repeats